jgi:hypothetical protein
MAVFLTPSLQSFKLWLHFPVEAIGTKAVRKQRFRTLGNVLLQLSPDVPVVPNLLAV